MAAGEARGNGVNNVSWPYTLTPFALEGANTVDGTWQPVDSWVIDQGGEHQVFLPTPNPMPFFRLEVNGSVLTFDTDRSPRQCPDGDFEALEQAQPGLRIRLPAAHELAFSAFEE